MYQKGFDRVVNRPALCNMHLLHQVHTNTAILDIWSDPVEGICTSTCSVVASPLGGLGQAREPARWEGSTSYIMMISASDIGTAVGINPDEQPTTDHLRNLSMMACATPFGG